MDLTITNVQRLDRQTIRYNKDIQCSDIAFVSVILSIWKTNNNQEEDDLKSGTITVTNFSEGTSASIAPCHIRHSEVVIITVPNCNQYIAFPNFLSKQVKIRFLKMTIKNLSPQAKTTSE